MVDFGPGAAKLAAPPAWRGWLVILVSVLLISFAHYLGPHHLIWFHQILRRSYYLPIGYAAVRFGLRGGMTTALLVTALYAPHAFLVEHAADPSLPVEKAGEVVLFFLFAALVGAMADRLKKRASQMATLLEQQRTLERDLIRAGRLASLGEVVAGMAHEIKNPLHVLGGTAEIVDPAVPEDSEERRMWEIHRQELARLEEIVERFLSFARPGTAVSEPLDMREVADRLVNLAGAEARQRRLEVVWDRPDQDHRVRGDHDLLVQLGLNLVLNAFQAMADQGGRLELRLDRVVRADRQWVRLSFLNDGPPIPDAELERIFDPFHTSRSEGTGLGLAIAARIADEHGGLMNVTSSSDGVCFDLLLPALDSEG